MQLFLFCKTNYVRGVVSIWCAVSSVTLLAAFFFIFIIIIIIILGYLWFRFYIRSRCILYIVPCNNCSAMSLIVQTASAKTMQFMVRLIGI